MSLQRLDDVLGFWKTQLSIMAANLLDLQCDAGYQSLTGSGGLDRANVTGATEQRVGPALRQMNSLFQQFGALQSVVDRAEEIRRGLPTMFGSEGKLREIEQLLYGRSVDAGTPDARQGEAHLLSAQGGARRLTPDEMLRSMTQTFSIVRSAVSEVSEAWSTVAARTEALFAEVQAMRSQTVMPTQLIAPALDSIEEKIRAVLQQAKADPLGSVTSLNRETEADLGKARARLTEALRLAENLKAAGVRFCSVREVHEQARAKSDAVCTRVLDSKEVRYGSDNDDTVQALGEWLSRLERKADDGLHDAVVVGLRRWDAAADLCLTRSKAVVSACDRAVQSRGELRGRFDALKAKARAYGVSGLQPLSTVCSRVEEVLYQRPVDLQQAAQALATFEHHLSAACPRDQHATVAAR